MSTTVHSLTNGNAPPPGKWQGIRSGVSASGPDVLSRTPDARVSRTRFKPLQSCDDAAQQFRVGCGLRGSPGIGQTWR
ncbi:MAG TPA: hypothetical protein VGY48_12075 [Vicinamibacterales bacterium]|nr:hypothetical protein [Vicinamibacterales bacterium]